MKHTCETIHFSKVVRLKLFAKRPTIFQKVPSLQLYEFEVNAKLACRYFQQHSHNFYVYFYLDHSSQVTLELRWCHNIPKYIWVHDVIPLNYVLFHIVYNIYKHKLVHDTQRAQHAQSKEHSTYIVTSEIMKAILCAHPPHHQNGFVATCRLWTASGGVIYINMVCIYKYSIYFELKFFGFHVQSWSDW